VKVKVTCGLRPRSEASVKRGRFEFWTLNLWTTPISATTPFTTSRSRPRPLHSCRIATKDPSNTAPRDRDRATMPKFFCDYCDVYLTHDSMSVRKAHNSGRNHLRNVVDYYQQIGHEKAQSVIDSITNSYAAEGQSANNPMLNTAPPGFGPPGGMMPPAGLPPGFPMPPGGMPPGFPTGRFRISCEGD
jgi:hypothetical protein